MNRLVFFIEHRAYDIQSPYLYCCIKAELVNSTTFNTTRQRKGVIKEYITKRVSDINNNVLASVINPNIFCGWRGWHNDVGYTFTNVLYLASYRGDKGFNMDKLRALTYFYS